MIVLLDNGHGSLINEEYQTVGKRSPVWNGGLQLYEGEFNRAIVNGIVQELTKREIAYVNIAPEYKDLRLETRIKRANKYYRKNSFYLSIQANVGGGYGIFTFPGETKGIRTATILGSEYHRAFPTRDLRTDFSNGNLDKERRFYVLTRTKCLLSSQKKFMDNKENLGTSC